MPPHQPQGRKHFTGLCLITQDPVADLALMGDQFITQQLIMPFEDKRWHGKS